ncbi:hypothetical protein PF006_g21405 [Phytophthora fragariae]|uniref:Peptidase A2 domain-containing protein n=1 Tax=Phytophthora fragariae TaxID=53985 RepID=A0A6A3EDD8_9STRA|nr:hypothetical protein PF009_g19331 [Phytophthora fragariae]KAE9106282.1 hypothetical protein PF006_g21405 [Phytophthora fragariae]
MELDFEEEGGADPRLAAAATTAMVSPPWTGTKLQLNELARTSAAADHTAVEQIDQVRRQQGEIAAKTSEYLQQQYDQQLDLRQQQEDIRKQMEEQRQHLQEQFRLLKAAEEAMGRQEKQIEDLTEAARPHIEARWGLFAEAPKRAETEARETRPAPEPTVMLAAGANMPVPPMYRGSTKKEKREFMDSYMVYKRRVDALNQGTQTRVFTMPLGACIEQGTLARKPDFTAYKKLQQAVRSLAIDVGLNDASSRLSKLLADFYEILDDLNMEEIIHENPKTVVEYLANALRPPTFKATIKDYLSRPSYKHVKRDVQVFLKWLKPQLEEFMKYEAHIPVATPTVGSSRPQTQQNSGQPRGFAKPAVIASQPAPASSQQALSAPEARATREKKPRQQNANNKTRSHECFKCQDPTHGVFQCPNVANAQEANALYEQRTGRNVALEVPISAMSSVGAPPVESMSNRSPIPAQVNGLVETSVTLDSGAGVTLISPDLWNKLRNADGNMSTRKMENPALFEGVGGATSMVQEELQLDFKFDTPGGPLVLRRVRCWVGTLPSGVGEVLLADEVMARLG